MNKKISVKELIKKFNFHVVNNGNINNRYITNTGISRIGIQLLSNLDFKFNLSHSIVCFGNTELIFFKKTNKKNLKLAFEKIKKINPPLIILNSNFKNNDIKLFLKHIKKTSIPIVSTNLKSTSLYFELSPWVARKIAPSSIIHGTLLSIFGVGVLIIGNAEIGKSEVAMDLIKIGHLFIADDAIEVYNFGNLIYGKSTNISKNFIEARGVGIIDVNQMFGWQKTINEQAINVVIELVQLNEMKNNFNPFNKKSNFERIRNVSIPKYYIPILPGRIISNLIESAIIDYKLQKNGFNANENYLKNYDKIIKESKK